MDSNSGESTPLEGIRQVTLKDLADVETLSAVGKPVSASSGDKEHWVRVLTGPDLRRVIDHGLGPMTGNRGAPSSHTDDKGLAFALQTCAWGSPIPYDPHSDYKYQRAAKPITVYIVAPGHVHVVGVLANIQALLIKHPWTVYADLEFNGVLTNVDFGRLPRFM